MQEPYKQYIKKKHFRHPWEELDPISEEYVPKSFYFLI